MKGGKLMRSERTAAEFDILVAFLGALERVSQSSDMGPSRERGPIATGYRVDHRTAFPPAGLGLVKAASDAGAPGDAGEAMNDAIVVGSGQGVRSYCTITSPDLCGA
jgi:hypothetical protein